MLLFMHFYTYTYALSAVVLDLKYRTSDCF